MSSRYIQGCFYLEAEKISAVTGADSILTGMILNNCCWFFSQYDDIAAREVQVREDGNAFPEYVVVIIFPQMLIETLEIN